MCWLTCMCQYTGCNLSTRSPRREGGRRRQRTEYAPPTPRLQTYMCGSVVAAEPHLICLDFFKKCVCVCVVCRGGGGAEAVRHVHYHNITVVSMVTGCKHTQKDKKEISLRRCVRSLRVSAVLITQHSLLLVSNEPAEGQSADTKHTHPV